MLTNNSAMSALKMLRSIDASLQNTQEHISSGLRIADAGDNASYWSIATTMRADAAALETVQDALGLAASKTDTAYSGMSAALDVVNEIKNKISLARESGVDKDKVNREITELKNQLVSIAQSASFSGENWLYNDQAGSKGTKSMVGSFVRDATGSVSIKTIDFDTANSVLIDTKNETRGLLTKNYSVSQKVAGTSTATTAASFVLIDGGVSTATSSGATGVIIQLSSTTSVEQIDAMLSAVDNMAKALTDAAATLGSVNKRITLQNDFVKDLTDVITKGVGRLVDADMNEESTKLKALQTQQQLGIQALSIANNQAQSILQLFR